MALTVNYSVHSALAGPRPVYCVHAQLDIGQMSGMIGFYEPSDSRWLEPLDTCPPLRHSMSNADIKHLWALIEQYHRNPLGEYEPQLVVDGHYCVLVVRGDIEMQMSWGSDTPDTWMEQVAPLENFLNKISSRYPTNEQPE